MSRRLKTLLPTRIIPQCWRCCKEISFTPSHAQSQQFPGKAFFRYDASRIFKEQAIKEALLCCRGDARNDSVA